MSFTGILVKFRQRKVGFSGDITDISAKFGLGSKIVQLILWSEKEDEEPSTYPLEVMMFGSVCSPYCAQIGKNANALEFG